MADAVWAGRGGGNAGEGAAERQDGHAQVEARDLQHVSAAAVVRGGAGLRQRRCRAGGMRILAFGNQTPLARAYRAGA